MVWT